MLLTELSAGFRKRVIDLKREGLTYKQVGEALKISDTAAQNANSLQRAMNKAGVSDPYIRVECPDECPRIKRHKHQRFQFRTVEEFTSPPSVEEWLRGVG